MECCTIAERWIRISIVVSRNKFSESCRIWRRIWNHDCSDLELIKDSRNANGHIRISKNYLEPSIGTMFLLAVHQMFQDNSTPFHCAKNTKIGQYNPACITSLLQKIDWFNYRYWRGRRGILPFTSGKDIACQPRSRTIVHGSLKYWESWFGLSQFDSSPVSLRIQSHSVKGHDPVRKQTNIINVAVALKERCYGPLKSSRLSEQGIVRNVIDNEKK